jgi:hypothetical protein
MKRSREVIRKLFNRLPEESKSRILGMVEALTFVQRRERKSRERQVVKESA